MNLTLTGTPKHVQLKNTKGQIITANSLPEIMQEQLGWQLPVTALQYWVRGLIAPGASQAHYNTFGLLSQLKQNGFLVRFDRYQRKGQYDLPSILTITGHQLKIKLVIKQWRIH